MVMDIDGGMSEPLLIPLFMSGILWPEWSIASDNVILDTDTTESIQGLRSVQGAPCLYQQPQAATSAVPREVHDTVPYHIFNLYFGSSNARRNR